VEDCNTYSGLRLQDDNSSFSGEFRTRNRSGYHLVVDTPVTDTLIAQLIAFDRVSEIAVGDADYQLRAVATSGLPVTFSSSDASVAVIVNGYLHVLKAGDVVITASQPGNARYLPAASRQ
jgi:hypothetical protein